MEKIDMGNINNDTKIPANLAVVGGKGGVTPEQSKNAFTLSEVILTIGIMGIIAALTIPQLIQNSNNKELVSAFLKSNNVLANAYKNAKAIDNIHKLGGDSFKQTFKKYVKTVECEGHDICLKDGMFVDFECDENACTSLTVDTNGQKKPNTPGKDNFRFLITQDAIIPDGEQDDCSGLDCSRFTLTYHKLFGDLIPYCVTKEDNICTRCMDQYKIVDEGTKCEKLDYEHCNKYDGENCQTCDERYYLSDSTTCSQIPIDNCATTEDNGATCNSCVEGYLSSSAKTQCSKVFKVNDMDVVNFTETLSTNDAIAYCASLGEGYELPDFDTLKEIWDKKDIDTENVPQDGVYCTPTTYINPSLVSSTNPSGYSTSGRTWCINFITPTRPFNGSYYNNNGHYVLTGAIWEYPRCCSDWWYGQPYMCVKK